MRTFLKSALIGALVPASPFLFLTTALAFGMAVDRDPIADVLWIALLPLTVTVPVVLAASLLIGLPLTRLLHRYGRESGAAYLLGGALAGGLIPILLFLSLDSHEGAWLGLPGALGGGVTGWTWWTSEREPKLLAQAPTD